MSRKTRANLLLLITAFVWGCAFVAQREGLNYVNPFTYNMSRSIIGGIALIPVIALINRKKASDCADEVNSGILPDKVTLRGGMLYGAILAVASGFQQYGMLTASAGKTSFITALYIVIVPILGVFIGKRIRKIIWFCVALAISGFYLLCVRENLTVQRGDLLILCCSLFFAVHILVIDHFMAEGADGVKLACIQFFVSGLLSLVAALLFEKIDFKAIANAAIPILYAGLISSGVGYTLQIVAQKDAEPTTATLIMSLESVFGALAGWIFLHELFSIKELFGCVLVFAAVILAQIPEKGDPKNV